MPDIVAMGECMVELYADEPVARASVFHRSYGGDTLNTLVAAARLGSTTRYITRVGSDPFTPYLLEAWRSEGVDTSTARQVAGPNGLYIISLLPGGEREFAYYRRGSAASTLSSEDVTDDALRGARIFHTSGITQAISPSARRAVLEGVRRAKALGLRVSFDPNLRPALWPSLAEARAALEEVLPFVDIFLPSAPEESEQLLGVRDAVEAARACRARGVPLALVKQGKDGCVVAHGESVTVIPAYDTGAVVDTTGAGDAFDGAALHALARGMDPVSAARLGTITAGLKVRGRGAVRSLPTGREVYALFERGAGISPSP
ncbi:MAG: sugar kinase [Dehalococcoidia bacterium]|nr:sugar kinase [Dehalococcoidia bacterium]